MAKKKNLERFDEKQPNEALQIRNSKGKVLFPKPKAKK